MKEVHLDDEIMPFGSLDKTGLGWNGFEFERRRRIDFISRRPYCAPGAKAAASPGANCRRSIGNLIWGYLANAG
jgi:hypothetical protein